MSYYKSESWKVLSNISLQFYRENFLTCTLIHCCYFLLKATYKDKIEETTWLCKIKTAKD